MTIAALKTVFDFRDYQSYLRSALPTSGPSRGARTRLAEVLGCQNGFISLVLNGAAHFSTEHAMTVGKFLKHSEAEQDYFLLLICHARAGSKDLQIHYQKKIDEIFKKRREIRERIQVRTELSEASQAQYYSSWHYTAIHMILFTPGVQTPEKIASALEIPLSKVQSVLDFLIQCGLVETRRNRLIAKPSRTHLPADSPLVAKHHSNWRMRAIQSLDYVHASDLHYSAVFSLSREGAEKIRTLLLEVLQESEPIIRDGEDETVCAMALDWFHLSGP
jgi:uncharacterized protein (TIGR02147 family)